MAKWRVVDNEYPTYYKRWCLGVLPSRELDVFMLHDGWYFVGIDMSTLAGDYSGISFGRNNHGLYSDGPFETLEAAQAHSMLLRAAEN